MERILLNTFLGNFQQKFMGENVTCIIFILFHLGRQTLKVQLVQFIWVIISDQGPFWVNWPKRFTLILLR